MNTSACLSDWHWVNAYELTDNIFMMTGICMIEKLSMFCFFFWYSLLKSLIFKNEYLVVTQQQQKFNNQSIIPWRITMSSESFCIKGRTYVPQSDSKLLNFRNQKNLIQTEEFLCSFIIKYILKYSEFLQSVIEKH